MREALRALHADARAGVPLDHEALPRRIVEIVYADVDPVLWPAAELSVRAQLAYLRRSAARPSSRPTGSDGCGWLTAPPRVSGRGGGGGRRP